MFKQKYIQEVSRVYHINGRSYIQSFVKGVCGIKWLKNFKNWWENRAHIKMERKS